MTEKTLTIIIQRHGNASPNDVDAERMLSDKGMTQAAAMQATLAERRLDGATLVLSSTAQRAHDTVALDGNVVKLPRLYLPEDPKDGAELDTLFAELKYAPLRTYLERDATGCVKRWGEAASAAIAGEIQVKTQIQFEQGLDCVVRIGAHAVLSNLIALALIPEECAEMRDEILDHSLGEACCFIVTIRDNHAAVEIVSLAL